MRRESRDEYQAWLLGVVLLIGLLGTALALFVTYPSLLRSCRSSASSSTRR